ncbi:MAG: NUDIX hydrolase [Vulcanimicrobiaceae bacterium]
MTEADAPRDDRAALLADLARYEPSDARERVMRDRLHEFVAATTDCFERSSPVGHVTGSAWIVDRDTTAAVLVHHRKLGRWLQPGGHADGDGDIRRVARREAVEETGLTSVVAASADIYDVDVHAIPARPGEIAHEHFDVRFAFYADRNESPIVSDESHAVAWVALADVADRGDASVARLVRKTASLSRPT